MCMLHTESEVLLTLLSDHLVRMLRVASTLPELDAATFATQASSLSGMPLPQHKWRPCCSVCLMSACSALWA